MKDFTVIVITGPTASGKSDLAVALARQLSCHILSADSRQIFQGIPIGTAAPSDGQLSEVPHHLIGKLPLDAYYSAAEFESDALGLIDTLLKQGQKYLVVCGGSMMYIDALTRGIDSLPTISPEVRERAYRILNEEGREAVIAHLQLLDPEYLKIVDLNNGKRLVHALEICWQANAPFSSLRTGTIRQRPFRILQFALCPSRETLFSRINSRVDKMIELGLEEEAHNVYHLRHLNSLNTVGYKELFQMSDGLLDRETAIGRIKKNTRVYAKKQLTWLKKRPEINILPPDNQLEQILSYLPDLPI